MLPLFPFRSAVWRFGRGGLAKWLCSGLQIRLRRFDSGTRLQFLAATATPNRLISVDNLGDGSKRPGGEIGSVLR